MTSRYVVDAEGPWVRSLLEGSPQNTFEGLWCIGFNVLFKKLVSEKYAIAVSSKQGRLFFITPREDKSILGTEYLRFAGFPEKPVVPE